RGARLRCPTEMWSPGRRWIRRGPGSLQSAWKHCRTSGRPYLPRASRGRRTVPRLLHEVLRAALLALGLQLLRGEEERARPLQPRRTRFERLPDPPEPLALLRLHRCEHRRLKLCEVGGRATDALAALRDHPGLAAGTHRDLARTAGAAVCRS